jgi:arylsulfatase A-like enzyme
LPWSIVNPATPEQIIAEQPLQHRFAARHRYHRPRDVARLIRRQQYEGWCQLLGLARTRQRDLLAEARRLLHRHCRGDGPHYNEWPDGGITPFRSEKNTNWEGAFRVPAAVRWPGHIPAGTVVNGIVSHKDWVPTLLAAAGEPDIKEKLLTGYQAGDKNFRVTSTASTCCRTSRARRTRARAATSSISATTAS